MSLRLTGHPAPEDLDLDRDGADRVGDDDLNLRACRERAERTVLLRALARSDGNLSQAARLTGVSRPTFYDLLRHHGLCADMADADAANGVAQAPG